MEGIPRLPGAGAPDVATVDEDAVELDFELSPHDAAMSAPDTAITSAYPTRFGTIPPKEFKDTLFRRSV